MLRTLFELVYPKVCLYCQSPLEDEQGLFCIPCQTVFSFIPARVRCSRCYEVKAGSLCRKCMRKSPLQQKHITLFDSFSPANALLDYPIRHAETIAALFYVRWYQANWPIPEKITTEKALSIALPRLQKWFAIVGKKEEKAKITLHLSRERLGLGLLPEQSTEKIYTMTYKVVESIPEF